MTSQTSAAQTLPYASTKSNNWKTDCGCSKGSGECHCGSSNNATCGCNEGLLVQPHFFAGQLLTDEDLQALTNYMVTKYRLHNRYVVGSGVSCGLAVTCHPCGQGKVIVQPGYAIDCCGNEILVPCPVELDINAMVRDLKFKRLGRDCGDPCKDTLEKGRDPSRKDCGVKADRYCLYLRYCELPTDPIAPYSQDESCNTSCQPTRLREGFSFELRCPDEEVCPPSLWDRIRCCIGDLDEAEFQAGKFERVQHQSQRAKVAIQAFSLNKSAQFTDNDPEMISGALSQLTQDAPLFKNGELRESALASSEKIELSEKVLRRTLDNVQTLGTAIARWELLDAAGKNQLLQKSVNLGSNIDQSRELLNDLTPKIGERAPQFFTSPIEVAAANATVANSLKYIDSELSIEQRRTYEANLYAYSVISNREYNSQVNQDLANFKNWLLRKMHRCPPTTECGLIKEVSAVVIPESDSISDATVSAIDTLVRVFIRYLLDCICTALIPPCPSCDDPAVKLACLEVKDCEVDNICNMERTFLLTEHNLRYWLPFLHGFGETLEKLCCQLSKKFDKPLLVPSKGYEHQYQVQMIDRANYFTSGQQVSDTLAAQAAYPYILRATGLADASVRSTLNISNSLSNVLFRQPQITGLYEQRDKLEAASEVGTMTLASVFEHPQAKAAIRMATSNQLGEIESRFESRVVEGLKEAEEMQERTNKRIRDLEQDVSKGLTVNKLSSSDVIKKLQASLEEQVKLNKALNARLIKLEEAAKK